MLKRGRLLAAYLSMFFLTGLLSGCPSGSGVGLDESGRPLDESDNTPPPALGATFEALQANVFTPACTVCHAGAAAPVGLRLDAANSYASLVSVSSVQVPGILRVAPGDPDSSYLIQKIEGTAAVGAQMPLGGPFLDAATVALIRQWITDGALPPAPPAADEPPVVLASSPEDGAEITSALSQITVRFSKPMDASLVSDATVQLEASGGDAQFGDGTDVSVAPLTMSLAANALDTLVIDLAGFDLADDTYRLRLIGSGPTALADLDGLLLDGDGDGAAGGDAELMFTLNTAAPPPQPTFASIQSEIFTPFCTVCHIDGGQAAFLPLDETNSYDALVGVASTEVPSLLRVEPLNADSSYLVQKLEGTAAVGGRMPLGGDPLPPEFISAVRVWIDTGAVRTPGDPVPDVIPPLVVVSAPGGELSGTVTLVAEASDASMIDSVGFLIDDVQIATDSVAPYEATLDTTLFEDGEYALEAAAVDGAGNIGRSTALTISIVNMPPGDTEPPQVSLAAPGSPVSGVVTLSAAAVDNDEVAVVRFFANDVLLAADSEAPYAFDWDTTGTQNGDVTLVAQAEDASGNTADSNAVQLVVDNAPPPDTQAPVVTLQTPPSPVSGSIIVTAEATDNVGVTAVRFVIDGAVVQTSTAAPYTLTLDTTTLTDGVHDVQAQADDAAGNTGVSPVIQITVDNTVPGDTTPPTVTLSDPGNPVSGSVTFMATAADDVAIADVTFLVDDNVVATDTSEPYTTDFDSTTLADGSHTLQARARDTSGNTGESALLSITVDNADRIRPAAELSLPAGPVSGVVAIDVTATDNEGIASVTVFIDGVAIGTSTVAPYQVLWDTSGVIGGAHVVAATATDTSGNVAAASPALIDVESNAPEPTLPWIQANIFDVSCAAGCHIGGGIASFLRLDDAEDSFAELVNVPASEGGSSLRVTPFDADDSALMQRLDGTLTPSMPLGGALLPADERNAVRAWIDGGALEFPADVISPGIALTPPAAQISGSVTLEAVAVDDVGVTAVTLFVDDLAVGEANITPFSIVWDSSTVTDGEHQIRAQAVDAAGNVGMSLEFQIEVANTMGMIAGERQ